MAAQAASGTAGRGQDAAPLPSPTAAVSGRIGMAIQDATPPPSYEIIRDATPSSGQGSAGMWPPASEASDSEVPLSEMSAASPPAPSCPVRVNCVHACAHTCTHTHTHTHTRTHTQASATSSWARMYVTPTSFWCSRLRRRSVPMHTCRYLYVLLLSIYPSIYTQTHTHFAAGLYQCQYICTYAYIHTYIDHIDR